MRITAFILLYLYSASSHAWWFSHDNYWECLLENLEGIQSDTIANEVIESCQSEYMFYERTFVDKKYPWFGVKTADECVIKYGKHVKSEIAARYIQSACYKLYPDE
ncbi:MAG: hypothetical protein AAGB35_05555 [Pseudomonadota bacterium]